MDPYRPATRGGLVGLTASRGDESRRKDVTGFFSLFLFSLFYHTPAHLLSHSGFLSPPLASSPAPAAPLIFSLLCSVSPLLFYLLPVNRGVVQDLVITPGSVWLLADCCRGTVLA